MLPRSAKNSSKEWTVGSSIEQKGSSSSKVQQHFTSQKIRTAQQGKVKVRNGDSKPVAQSLADLNEPKILSRPPNK